MNARLRTFALVAAIGVGLLTGCSVPVQGTAAPAGSSGSLINESSTPLPTQAPVVDVQASFGETMAWQSGLQVKVDAPVEVRVSQYHRKSGQRALKFDVTLVNNTDEPVSAQFVSTAVTHNGSPADQVFDSANGFSGAPTNDVLPGKTITYPVVFQMPKDAGELQMDVSPMFLSETVYFVGTF